MKAAFCCSDMKKEWNNYQFKKRLGHLSNPICMLSSQGVQGYHVACKSPRHKLYTSQSFHRILRSFLHPFSPLCITLQISLPQFPASFPAAAIKTQSDKTVFSSSTAHHSHLLEVIIQEEEKHTASTFLLLTVRS